MTGSLDEQINLLRPGVISGFAARMHLWFIGGAVLGLIAALVLWHPVPLMIAVFLGLVGLSERHCGANIVAAIMAYDSDTPSQGSIAISISAWDSSDTFHVTVRESEHPDWVYEFIPQGWKPKVCFDSPAKIWRAKNGSAPVSVIIEDGVMIPRYPAKLVSANDTP